MHPAKHGIAKYSAKRSVGSSFLMDGSARVLAGDSSTISIPDGMIVCGLAMVAASNRGQPYIFFDGADTSSSANGIRIQFDTYQSYPLLFTAQDLVVKNFDGTFATTFAYCVTLMPLTSFSDNWYSLYAPR